MNTKHVVIGRELGKKEEQERTLGTRLDLSECKNKGWRHKFDSRF